VKVTVFVTDVRYREPYGDGIRTERFRKQFVGKSVRARYRYVEQENPRTRCVRAPCPPVLERVLDITGLEEVSGVNAPGK